MELSTGLTSLTLMELNSNIMSVTITSVSFLIPLFSWNLRMDHVQPLYIQLARKAGRPCVWE